MISGRLVQLIEAHADKIISRVIDHIRRNPEVAPVRPVLEVELREWGQDLLHNLGHWMGAAGKEDLARRYERLGRKLHEQNIPLYQALRAQFLIREHALDYVEEQVSSKTSVELYAEEEVDRALTRFFDLIAIQLVRGYEAVREKAVAAG